MLYLSICILICFIIYCIFEPSINIYHYYFDKNKQNELEYQKEKDYLQQERLDKFQEQEQKRLEEEEEALKKALDEIKNVMEEE